MTGGGPDGHVPAIVVVGAASRDVASDDPRGWRLGGGVTYAALTLARLGLQVGAIMGVDAAAATAAELGLLLAAGVETRLVPLGRGPVFVNEETPAGRVQQVVEASDPVPTGAVPAAWRDARAWLLAPVAAELGAAWADVPSAEAQVGTGWQGLLRRLEAGSAVRRLAPAESPIVRRADLVGVGRDDLDPQVEVETLTGLLRPGATLLLTGGMRGGLAVEVGADGRPLRPRAWAAIPAVETVDPTGAGDVFLAGVFAARVEPRLVGGRLGSGWDLRLGAAAASLACEATGLSGVAGREAIRRRMAEVRAAG